MIDRLFRGTPAVPALLVAFAAAPLAVAGQTTPPEFVPATMPMEAERDPDTYVLESLGRHGPSHFPRVRLPEVEYEVLCRRHYMRRMTSHAARAAALSPEVLPFDLDLCPVPQR